ncbi:MFS transporter [Aliidiomarina maris]|uniref:MFS transporter n=1 Tax=Aliidiomarina maris TaxID=531312 RepID=A0A327WPK2_9GAMM|nr:MFS transporter [Aliidiomarina maris]RAJ93664.1 PPP family 3-phenylpropionic acid transporter [Aliidiomarina maris]RUO19381.1 MFS transporter [Aliidiomarina maris]
MLFYPLTGAANRQAKQLTFAYFGYFSVLAVIVPYLAVYLDAIGFNSRQIGELIAIITACRVFGPPLWATLADKTGRCLPFIRLGAVAAGLLFVALTWSNEYWWVALTLGLLSLFWSAILPQLEVLSLSTLGQQAQLYSRIRVGGSLGFIAISLVIGELLAATGAQRLPIYGALLVTLLLVTTLGLFEPAKRAVHTTNPAHLGSIWQRIVQRRFLTFLISTTLLQASFAPFYAFFALYLQYLGYAPYAVGLLIALGVVVEVGMFLVAGKYVARYGVRNILLLCMLATAVRWSLMGQFADIFWWLLLAQGLHAFSFALHHSAAIQFIHQHFPSAEQSRGQALYVGFGFGAGGALGAYLAGMVWQQHAGASLGFMGAAGLALIAAFVCAWMGQDKPQPNNIASA